MRCRIRNSLGLHTVRWAMPTWLSTSMLTRTAAMHSG